MVESMRSMLISCKASVASGPCFTGSVGIKECRRVVVLGDAVNVSERNLAAISDGVVNDLNTSNSIGKALPQVALSGSSSKCFRPYDDTTKGGYRHALDTLHRFRRENQLRVASNPLYKTSKPCAELTKHVMSWINDSYRSEKNRIIVVEGPIGSGKSEMISHTLSDERIHRVARVLYVWCF